SRLGTRSRRHRGSGQSLSRQLLSAMFWFERRSHTEPDGRANDGASRPCRLQADQIQAPKMTAPRPSLGQGRSNTVDGSDLGFMPWSELQQSSFVFSAWEICEVCFPG